MKTDIPTELVEAHRELVEAQQERDRLSALYEAANDRQVAAWKRHEQLMSQFRAQVWEQLQEFVGSGEGT